MMTRRQYDVVLYGASGFVGRQAVRYFAEHAPAVLRWAIAGRDRQKLEASRTAAGEAAASVDVVVADGLDTAAVEPIVSASRVVLNTAGPFSRYANNLVDACVRLRTHYVDITGETPWVRQLIDRYHQRAAADGTRIVPCCGFDSVPSDLAALLAVRELQRTTGAECQQVKAFYRLRGGFNGGTLATMLNLYESGAAAHLLDPFYLEPETAIASRKHVANDGIQFDRDARAWRGPFFMAPINTHVVQRSAALAAQWGEPYGSPFRYDEFLAFRGLGGFLTAHATKATFAAFEFAMRRASLRRLLERFLPKPGSGPSPQSIENGWFRCETFARTATRRGIKVVVRDRGDPSNRVTVKCVCEAAFCLAVDADRLPGGQSRGGVLTPATAFGEVLVERLRQAGMKLEASSIAAP